MISCNRRLNEFWDFYSGKNVAFRVMTPQSFVRSYERFEETAAVSIFRIETGDIKFLRNVYTYVPNYLVPVLTRL